MQKILLFLVHVRDHCRAAVDPALDPDVRDQAHQEQKAALTGNGQDPRSSPGVPRSPTKYQLSVCHPVIRCTL